MNSSTNGVGAASLSVTAYHLRNTPSLVMRIALSPLDAKALAKYSKNFPKLNLVTVDDEFGGWKKAQSKHFEDGGTFDQIYDK